MHIIADIGGTKTRIVGSKDLKVFSGDPLVIDTPQQYETGLAAIGSGIRQIASGEHIERIIIGIRGLISKDHTSTHDHVLADWSDRPLSTDLQMLVNAGSVTLNNDLTLNSIGEAVYGAGRGAPIVVYYTVSTGVNATRVVRGRVEPAAQGFEAGGQYLSITGVESLEDLVSGGAISKKYGKHPKELGKDNPLWEKLAEIFAYGLHNSIVHWSPNRVVLGGSMFNEIGISVDRVTFHLKRIMKKFPEIPEIVHSSLGDVGGLWGGLALLNQTD